MLSAQTADVCPARRSHWNHADVVDEFTSARRSSRDTCVLRAEDLVLLVIE